MTCQKDLKMHFALCHDSVLKNQYLCNQSSHVIKSSKEISTFGNCTDIFIKPCNHGHVPGPRLGRHTCVRDAPAAFVHYDIPERYHRRGVSTHYDHMLW